MVVVVVVGAALPLPQLSLPPPTSAGRLHRAARWRRRGCGGRPGGRGGRRVGAGVSEDGRGWRERRDIKRGQGGDLRCGDRHRRACWVLLFARTGARPVGVERRAGRRAGVRVRKLMGEWRGRERERAKHLRRAHLSLTHSHVSGRETGTAPCFQRMCACTPTLLAQHTPHTRTSLSRAGRTRRHKHKTVPPSIEQTHSLFLISPTQWPATGSCAAIASTSGWSCTAPPGAVWRWRTCGTS
jgi:hypothetical protein